ncbi:MAG: glycosyltransferase [Candidatus Margulisiibacteriota bacterium]
MRKYTHNTAFIIPTKDRPDDLRKLLASLERQTCPVCQLIIVDGSDNSIEYLLSDYPKLQIDYKIVRPPGLTRQRNEGMKMLRAEIDLVGYLDDDLVLEDDAVENLHEFWEAAGDDVGGASFNIVNNISSRFNWFTYIFDMNKGKQGVVLKSGYNVVLFPVEQDTRVEWLCGGATIWRRGVIDEYKYDETISGFGYYDDVDYSLTVNKKYKLFMMAGSRVYHFPPQRKGRDQFKVARSIVINRYILVRKHKELSLLHFYWAVLGQIIVYTLLGIIRLNKERLLKASGVIAGIIWVLRGKDIH